MTDPSTALQALQELEVEELARYASDVEIHGTIAQFVTLSLGAGQTLWCSRGALMGYEDGVEWELRIPGGAGKALSRMLSGEGVTLTHVSTKRPGAKVTLTNNAPGRLVTWDLDRGPIICTPGSFVAALGQVEIDVTLARRAGAAFFGGAGLFLQKLSGTGIVIVHVAGDPHAVELKANQKLRISTGNLAVFSAGMDYDITGVGGCGRMVFGGEGLFMTQLTGPGWVVLQSLKRLPMAPQGQRRR